MSRAHEVLRARIQASDSHQGEKGRLLSKMDRATMLVWKQYETIEIAVDARENASGGGIVKDSSAPRGQRKKGEETALNFSRVYQGPPPGVWNEIGRHAP